MLNDILDSACIQNGRFNITLEDFDLDSLLTECLETAKLLYESPRVKVDYESQGSLMVLSDPVRLKRIVLNLLARSGKVTKSGQIRLAMKELGDIVEIRVEDSGENVSPVNHLSRLFSNSVEDIHIATHETGLALGLATA